MGTVDKMSPLSAVRNADPARARAHLDEARLQRSRHLIAITEGDLTALDVVGAACAEEGKPLRRISLRQLLLAQPRVGEQRARRHLSVVAAILGTNEDLGTKSIAWLIDPRSGGRRLLAWLDAQQPRHELWPGFPFAPEPAARLRIPLTVSVSGHPDG